MEYKISYNSKNVYDEQTSEVYLDYLILPCSSETVQRIDAEINVLSKHRYSIVVNKYGFEVMRFMGLNGISVFDLEMKCRVHVNTELQRSQHQLAEQFNAWDILKSASLIMKNYFWLENSPLTLVTDEIANVYRPEASEAVLAYMQRLSKTIYNTISYMPGTTNTFTTAHEAFEAKCGVCQDIAHIFLGMARKFGIPSRYVSGYLFVQNDHEAQLHAWVEVLIPGLGWLGVDPTNDLLTNENYVKIAHGIDYTECPSIKGVVRGVVNHSTEYKVAMQQ